MNRAYVALLVAVTMCVAGTRTVSAQDMSFGLDEAETEAKPKKGDPKAAAQDTAETGDAPAGGDVIGELAASSKGASQATRDSVPRAREVAEEIYAVQQIYALR